MSKLKELTWEHHKNAERQEFASLMMSGKLHPDLYATYLWNQHKKYDLLEAMCGAHGIFAELGQNISRKLFIEEDFRELWLHDSEPKLVASTINYLQHMRDIMHDRDALMANPFLFFTQNTDFMSHWSKVCISTNINSILWACFYTRVTLPAKVRLNVYCTSNKFINVHNI